MKIRWEMPDLDDKRIRVIVGHYGSGKTEFSVNYALNLAMQGKKCAIVDLDIANPYFRSRERKELLEEKGVNVYSNIFGYNITADLPAISAGIKAPLENIHCDTVVDAGGDDSGARILIQFEKYFIPQNCDIFCVINGNRPETKTLEGACRHISRIEKETGLKTTGLINNTHLLSETKVNDILKGYHLCLELSEKLEIPLKYNCCTSALMDELKEKTNTLSGFTVFPIRLYMRERWLDR